VLAGVPVHVLIVAAAGDAAVADRWVAAIRGSQRESPRGADRVTVTAVDPAGLVAALHGLPDTPERRAVPLGVVVVGSTGSVGELADGVVRAAAGDGRVRALVLCGTPLSPESTSLLERWPEVAVLGLADPATRPALASVVDAHLASANEHSDLLVGPVTDDVVAQAARWLVARLSSTAAVEEIVLTTSDGWEVHATRCLPRHVDAPVPGIVLLHSGRSDRAVFARLERLLAERGMAVLNIDWRGRGRTINRGSYFDLSPEERGLGWRDAAAAVDHLAGLPSVDPQRLGAVGVVHGAEHAVRAAVRDTPLRAIAILTGYRPADEAERELLTGGAVDVLYVTSRDHTVTTAAMRALHDATPPGRSRFVEYPGGAIGYQLFELDHTLEPGIVDWLAEVLARPASATP
jgi:dienelactone hydrolase